MRSRLGLGLRRPLSLTTQRPVLLGPFVTPFVTPFVILTPSLQVRVVVVLGCFPQLEQRIAAKGLKSAFSGGFRVTSPEMVVCALEAAGTVRSAAEGRLSKGPSVAMVRRHQRTLQAFHFRPTVKVVSGNFVVAKRRGIVDGVDFGRTGEVRFICADDIKAHLDHDNIVLLGNVGYSARGEVRLRSARGIPGLL